MATGRAGRRRREEEVAAGGVPPAARCFTVSAADEGPQAPAPTTRGQGRQSGADASDRDGQWDRRQTIGVTAKHFIRKHPEDVVVHCSGCNSATRTFDGVDVMGRRLAEEVISVVQCRPELKKISFVAHSLGGLIARYAIALLYEPATQTDSHEEYEKDVNDAPSKQPMGQGKVAGLEPMNFITFATPHLGTRSHKQMPLLRGSYRLEKMAFGMSWLAGRSGKHLFIKDVEDEKSALRSFKRCVAYSNVCGDFVVGWKTSSIRRQHELPKKEDFVDDVRYPHVVYVEKPKARDVDFSDEMIYQAKTTSEMEEVMLKSLNRIPWERVDVSFKRSRQRILPIAPFR
ncbi:hypothetical protein ZWY2020_015136 [Hordeum vulgare]|nr:hypothetical protein ZWY2020_015136 [Hordeum vulgare]